MALQQQRSYSSLTHNVVANRYYASQRRIKARRIPREQRPTLHKLRDFLIEKIFKWAWHTIAHLLGSKHPFVTYAPPASGCHQLDESKGEITIALAGDWATNTNESMAIASAMMSHEPGYTIHLGDTYFVGDSAEISENFLIENAPWKKGPKGSFALMGNHEMYSMGRAYYDNLLPALGMRDSRTQEYTGQGASYFCLETTHWLIIALDTGYNSVGFPFVWNFLRTDSRLPEPLLEWLRTIVKVADDNRGIVFLSHHQYSSGFKKSKGFTKVGEQLAQIIGTERKVIWLWGHEHRFAVYGKYKAIHGITAYGRCIGHGGMPIEWKKEEVDSSAAAEANLVGYDHRQRQVIDYDNPIGWNGYAVMKINARRLSISYHDINEKKLLEEAWHVDEMGGIKGSVTMVPSDLTLHASSWDLMV